MTTIGELEASLTAAGQPFEVVETTVRGVPTRTWANAPASLRAVWDASAAYGGRDYLVYEDERRTFADAHHDAAIVGVPHATLGEEVAAVVRLRPGSRLDADGVRAHVADRLAAFKVPTVVDLRTDELPRNAAGKVLKRQLREELDRQIRRT